jgi:type I restriction enzyme S subunit
MFGRPGYDDKGWGLTTLGECCELNPRRAQGIDDALEVSFLAMPSVSEDGHMDTKVIRPYSEVKKGFTYFAERDVLFAKITPCMENGKGAVAEGLSNGIGAGSTEFHVLRPIPQKSNPYWLYIITMFEAFRINARKVMTGTGGQLRVPISYLKDYPITLPPIELQNEFEKFYRQSDKSKFTGFKSQFIEMFGYENDGMKTIDDIANICRGASPRPISKFVTDDEDGVNWIKIGDVTEEDIYITHTAEKITKEGAKKSRPVEPGDFILSNSMSFGRPYILGIHGCVHDGWLIISDYQNHLDPLFFYYELRSDLVQRQFDGSANGSCVKNLNSDLVKKVKIHIPPMDKQKEFVEFAQQSDKSK